MKNILFLAVILLSSCSQFNLDLLAEQIKDEQPGVIDQNFFEKGSLAEIKIMNETPKSFDCELKPPIVNGGYEVEYSYQWEYYRTQGDALSKKVTYSSCPKISTFKGGQISCKFQAKRLGTNIKSDFKIAYFKY